MPERLHPVLSALQHAEAARRGVVVTYHAATADVPHAFLLFPRRIFERSGHTYVEGWSIHRPTRIRLARATRDPGQQRRFRLDRILAVEPHQRRIPTITGYAIDKIRRRGVLTGLWGLLLDLLLVAFMVSFIVAMIRRFL